jgi:hypothetical protein
VSLVRVVLIGLAVLVLDELVPVNGTSALSLVAVD